MLKTKRLLEVCLISNNQLITGIIRPPGNYYNGITLQDEEKKTVDAPAMSELVEKENVDQLTYMGYEEVG